MQSSLVPKCLLVIAKSARMLVQMCVDSGCEVVAIDCFVDSDTRQMAKQTYQVSSLAWDDISAAVAAVREIYGLTELLYGSGLEAYPETLSYLEEDWRIIGNSAATFHHIQDKRGFFARLDSLAIRHPLLVFTKPEDSVDWLLKPWRGEGGLGIRRCNSVDFADGYWQRYIEGRSLSVLFAASRDEVELIGFNEQWVDDCYSEHPFMFGGIASHAEVPVAIQTEIADCLGRLAKSYELRGLNSLDFMLQGDNCYVLEINARISASAQLYGKSLLMKHLQAYQNRLDASVELSKEPSAYQIIYAQKKVTIPERLTWPIWVVDRPNPSAIVATGEPICSIIASGKNSGQVLDNLHRQQRILANLLETGL
ncbi:ATP-grasp domain-containing protein [Methylomonas rosea]|uniref:ATP-grasp domain-containing protein n=1 Tax=Methylomonas rosea TaxID=2952227 RepID=A0ABT1TWI7_9GAMM|nr:ATP-grasp domain-containing protein [Methylomonas sp. WSC-7]MCQ8118958.1 ATP-grasp domain-containing protein [Methylomonas sp. WSC-7]